MIAFIINNNNNNNLNHINMWAFCRAWSKKYNHRFTKPVIFLFIIDKIQEQICYTIKYKEEFNMDKKEIKHLAELSKLEFTDEELEAFGFEFEKLIELADTIKNAEINGEKKLNIIEMNDLREDNPKDSFSSEILLENAPDQKKGYFAVPRIVE